MNQQLYLKFDHLLNSVAHQPLPKHIHDQLSVEIQSLYQFVQQQDEEKSKALTMALEQIKTMPLVATKKQE